MEYVKEFYKIFSLAKFGAPNPRSFGVIGPKVGRKLSVICCFHPRTTKSAPLGQWCKSSLNNPQGVRAPLP